MRSPEFVERHTAAALFSETLLAAILPAIAAMGDGFSIADTPQLLVFMVIRLNDERGNPPISQRGIARELTTIGHKVSHQNVANWLRPLLARDMVKQSGRWGYCGNDGWLDDRIHSDHFTLMVGALVDGGKKLEPFDKR